jgi:membrane protease subunit (stomatin/prohibitin family)
MMSLRTSGSFAFTIIDPVSFLLRVVGSKALYTVEKVEELIEGLIQEAVQGVFSQATSFDELLDEKLEIAEEVSLRVSDILQPLGLKMHTFQIYSILPAQEVLDALHAKMAMQIVGDPVDYILYQAGKTFEKRPQLSNVLLRDTADLLAFANNRSAIPNQQSATSTEDSSTQKSQVSKIKKAR